MHTYLTNDHTDKECDRLSIHCAFVGHFAKEKNAGDMY